MQEKLAEFEVKNNKLESQLKKINDQVNQKILEVE